MMDAQPIQKQTKTEIKSYVYCEQCAVCVWDMLKCLTSLETFERHTKLMLTKYTMHVISLMTKCSNCIGKRALQLHTHARTCVHANECIMSTGVKRRRRKISQNHRHRHRNGALCVHATMSRHTRLLFISIIQRAIFQENEKEELCKSICVPNCRIKCNLHSLSVARSRQLRTVFFYIMHSEEPIP